MATDRLIISTRAEVERLHLAKNGKLNYYYRDQFHVYYETAYDGHILRLPKVLGDFIDEVIESNFELVIQANAMPLGLPTEYWRGDKVWATLSTAVLNTTLAGLSLVNTAITSSDSIIIAFGKLQSQIDNIIIILGNYVPLTRNITINGVTQDLSVDRTWTISAGGTNWNVLIDGGFFITPTTYTLIDAGSFI